MRRSLYIFGIIAIAFTACGGSTVTGKSDVLIKGEISGSNNKTLYLDEYPFTGNKLVTIDSIVLGENGAFEFEFNIASEEPTFYMLRFNQKNWIIVLAEKGDKMVVEGTHENFASDYTISGSQSSEELRALLSDLRQRNMKLQAMNMEIRQLKPRDPEFSKKRSSMALAMQKESQSTVTMVKEYINSKKATPLGAYACLFLDPQEEYAFLNGVYENFQKDAPSSKYTSILKSVLAPFKASAATSVGADAPDFVLKDQKGNNVSMSDFRGKLLLIDFWASWCGPCRRENPNVVKVYNQYKDKGFEILGVSLDTKKNSWEAAIKADRLTWYHVSDLAGWKSSAAQLYGVSSIPATFLISPEGQIIAKNLRGDALEQKIAELLN